MMILTEDMLIKAWPKASHALVDHIADNAEKVFAKYDIKGLRLAHFMAQISHESGNGTVLEENLNYSNASRIAQVWPSRFTAASAAGYVRNPKALANKVYSGRMGNLPGTDDGYNFRGRGLIQVTGRDGYSQVGKIAGMDLTTNPSVANSPDGALDIAGAFWVWKKLNPVADTDSVLRVTKIINGGTNGLGERQSLTIKWKRILGI